MDTTQVSAKKQIASFRPMGLKDSPLRRYLTQPVASVALLALFAASLPAPGMAQLPTIPSPVPQTPVNTVLTEDAYTLGPGDRVRLDIFDVPEYSGEFQVLVNGNLNLPVVGGVPVQGLTIDRASDVISQRYARYVRRPIVTLSLTAPRPLRLSVAGEVKRPGSYSVPLTAGQQFPTVTQAIELAGGITRSANVRQVEVRRRDRPTFTLNLWDLLERSDLSQDITLRDGDQIFIPTTTAIDPLESRQLAIASFAPAVNEPIKVAVVGEVVRPGPYTVTAATAGAATADGTREGGDNREPPTVTQAIQVAGGIKQSADIRRVQVRRTTREGSEQLIEVNLWNLLREGDLAQDVILQEGDTIIVPMAEAITAEESTELASASFSAAIINVNVVGEVQRPGTVQVPANSPLNQALLAAGGFDNRRARRSSVELVRLNPNGTVTKREVEVDFTAGVNDQTNPPLRPNDVVIVRRSGLTSFTDTLGTVVSPLGSFFTIFRLFDLF